MRPDTHECTWTGIACIPQADDVEQILRTYHPLTGTDRRVPSRPTWEFFLTDLQSLALYGNALTGSIPTQLNLHFSSVGANQLDSSVPTEL